MSITPETVQKLSRLSMLKYEEDKAQAVADDLNHIVDMISQLQDVNTDGVTPMSSSVSAASTREREDKVTDTNNREALLEVSPEQEMGFIVVPRVIE